MKRVPLAEVCRISMGQAPDGTSYNYEDAGFPLIAGAGDFGLRSPSPKKFTTQPTRLSEANDIILCIRATIGDLNWSDKAYCLGRGVAGLRPKPNELDRLYLWHFINANKQQLAALGTGSTFKQISRRDVETFEIPLPLLDEQRRIAAILDKADAIRRKRQQSIRLTEEFLRSTFLEMFGDPVTNPKGWDVATIRDLVSEVKYGTSDKASYEGKYPILRMNNITYGGGWNFSDVKRIDIPEKELSKYLVHKGDILFNRTNSKELVGKTAVYRQDEPMAFAGYLIRVRPNQHNNSEYIAAYLNSNHGKSTLEGMCKSIVGMANINAQELQDIRIMKPPTELQNKFGSIVQSVINKNKALSTASGLTDDLFNSLTHRAFRGEL